MPRVKKSQQHHHQPLLDDFPDPADLNLNLHDDEPAPEPEHEHEPEPEPEPERPRQSRKKNRNGNTRPPRPHSSSPESAIDEPIEPPDPPPSPPRNHSSLLNQLSFSTHTKSRPVDIRDELRSTEKVSDQYTPPSDAGLPEDLYGKSPNSVAISSAPNTPPVEPGFASRASYQIRSPPISPPQRNARPVSFGGSIPPLPSRGLYPPSNYGSPPAPHLPQPHFYGAHDIDIGVPRHAAKTLAQQPTFTRFTKLPGRGILTNHGIIFGQEHEIQICSYDGVTAVSIGTLQNLPGTPVDADILQWSSGHDPYAALRPLVAITLMHVDQGEGGSQQYRSSVSVYSLAQQAYILDLLHTPSQPVQHALTSHFAPASDLTSSLRLAVGGNYLTVSSSTSGEVFVFAPVSHESGPTFECLKKLWTTIQPRAQPRPSSHTRPSLSEAVRYASQRIKPDDNVPTVALSGRWLAVCPPATPQLQSAGMSLGEAVLAGRQAGVETLSAPTRTSTNCDVDSPDADTLMGKVARGVAQASMKAGKWLGEQGMQVWQNYWKKDETTAAAAPYPGFSSPAYHGQAISGQFPPTHAEVQLLAREPEYVSVHDLGSIYDHSRRSAAGNPPATFQPPHGCSFLSFAPNGLMLLTASRKGDYQYIWDLLEMKHSRASSPEIECDNPRFTPRVRQIARFDRLSGSTIVDVAWELPSLLHFAILTKNKTIHLFDIPPSALRWPSPRRLKKGRPLSAPPNAVPSTEHDAAPPGGFFTSAMNFAGRTPPMLTNWRGRAPSASTGLSGIGHAGFGIAAATGARGSRAVASGLSKSLGAATDTVSRLSHAGESRVNLKSEKDVVAGHLIWLRRATKPGLSVLGDHGLKHYQVRTSRVQDPKLRDATVFDARKAINVKLPSLGDITRGDGDAGFGTGFWNPNTIQATTTGDVHPLSFAEIDTNAPFQPFHSDHRVTISVFQIDHPDLQNKRKLKKSKTTTPDQWVFGDAIPSLRLNISSPGDAEDEVQDSAIYRETTVSNDVAGHGEQIVSTTRRRKPKRGMPGHGSIINGEEVAQEGFFEDDCDVLDFATDRV